MSTRQWCDRPVWTWSAKWNRLSVSGISGHQLIILYVRHGKIGFICFGLALFRHKSTNKRTRTKKERQEKTHCHSNGTVNQLVPINVSCHMFQFGYKHRQLIEHFTWPHPTSNAHHNGESIIGNQLNN